MANTAVDNALDSLDAAAQAVRQAVEEMPAARTRQELPRMAPAAA